MLDDMEKLINKMFKALSDTTRQEIFRLLCECEEELNVTDICSRFHITQPTVSHHLQILKNSELVDSRKEGKKIYYYVKKEVVNNVFGTIIERFRIEG